MGCDVTIWRATIGTFYCKISKLKLKCSSFFYTDEYNNMCDLMYVTYRSTVLWLCLAALQSSIPKYNIAYLLLVISIFLIESNTEILNPGPIYNPHPNDSSSDVINKHISIANINIRSVRNKTQYMQTFSEDFDIVTVTESHLDETIDVNSVKLDYFAKPLRRDRSRSGGGILIYVKEGILCTPKPELQNEIDETLWAEISYKGKTFLLCCTYRPEWTRVQYWDRLNHAISLAYERNQNIVITGDMNCDLQVTNNNKLIDTMRLFNLTNVINKPTRVTENSSTLLDPIIVSDSMQVSLSDVFTVPWQISDHRV